MVAGDEIAGPRQCRADARRNRLFTDVRVDAPGITPLRTSSIARCSNRRISRTVRYRSAESAMAVATPPPPAADGREDAVPQAGAGREGARLTVSAHAAHFASSSPQRSASICMASACAPRCHLDMTSQVVDEVSSDPRRSLTPRPAGTCQGSGPPRPNCECRGLHVDGRALDQAPGEPNELAGRPGHVHLVDRLEHRPLGAEPVDERIDDRTCRHRPRPCQAR